MHNQPLNQAPLPNPVELHPIDQEVLNLCGSLPALPLLVNPEILDRLREAPSSVHTIETTGRNQTRHEQSPEARSSAPVSRSLTPNLDAARDAEYDRSHFPPAPDPHRMEDLGASPEDRQDYTFRGYLLKPRIESYKRALQIYAEVDGSFGGKFSSRLQACRKFAWFVQSSVTNKLRVMSSRCKLRWCPICRDVSRMIVTSAVEGWLRKQKYPKMITLTLLHSDDPLQLQIKRIYDCFRKLRRRAYFQRLVTGGVWFFQLKYNAGTEQWHPHVHCLVAGKFLPHARLKALWHKITGDSHVVDIRPVKDHEACSNEVARYATSPADITAVSLERSIEIFYATRHRRICGSWGSAKSLALRPTPLEDTNEWSKVADFFFINVQKDYDPKAKQFWKCFKTGTPYEGPPLQRLTDVYREELLAFDSTCQEQIDIRTFIRLIVKGRQNDWKGFYGPLDRVAD
ncbi:hypothetical protein LCGC14_1283650 [marine sediment metagenome]|uniref:Replication protein n=1 Tax=marine sediment metagenome TaxID=412755 RepID=A0A0F9NB28_9ZZZZ